MKKIQIILAVLIVLGLGALFSHKFWVPNFVNYIIEQENKNKIIEVEDEKVNQIEKVILTGKNCYAYDQLATNEAPYEVHEILELNIDRDNITGNKKGDQKGPDMTNGYYGEILGEIKGDRIESIFSYIVEGSEGKEKEIYQIEENKLIKLRYVLKEDEKGILVPDITTKPNFLDYNKVDCIL